MKGRILKLSGDFSIAFKLFFVLLVLVLVLLSVTTFFIYEIREKNVEIQELVRDALEGTYLEEEGGVPAQNPV